MKTKFSDFINEFKNYEGEYFHFLTKKYDVEKAYNMIQKNPSKYLDENEQPYKISLDELSTYFSDGSFVEKNGKQMFKMGITIKPKYAMEISDEDLKTYGIFIIDGNSFNFLIDGWHRAYKLWKNGEKYINCYVIQDPDDIKKITIF